MRPQEAATRQSLFREVNERIRELPDGGGVGAICECLDERCTEPISLTLAEYERVRATPTHFAVKPGHVVPEFEQVVYAVGDRFVVVEKLAEAASAAERLDPRARGAPQAPS